MYRPDSKVYFPPEEHGYVKEDVYFNSTNGSKLHGWFFRAFGDKSKGTIVQFHGNGQNLTSHYATLVWLTNAGYDLLIFDYEGYGESEGEPEPKRVYEDGLAALEEGWKRHTTGKFIVYGQSLGVPVALRAVIDFKHKVDLVVSDSGFLSYKSIYSQALSRSWVTVIFSWIPYLVQSDEWAPKGVMDFLKIPLLVIHDESDPIIDFSNGEIIFKSATATPRKDFWKTNEGNHIAIFFLQKGIHRKKFLDYLDQI